MTGLTKKPAREKENRLHGKNTHRTINDIEKHAVVPAAESMCCQ